MFYKIHQNFKKCEKHSEIQFTSTLNQNTFGIFSLGFFILLRLSPIFFRAISELHHETLFLELYQKLSFKFGRNFQGLKQFLRICAVFF